jgi:hypothetical protein
MSSTRARHGANDAATKFVNEHTKIDVDPLLQEECPICLDAYAVESCVQITGIPNCTHRIGLNCLMKVLRDRPTEEKRCPLCRAAWIPGPTAPNAPAGLSNVDAAIENATRRVAAITQSVTRDRDDYETHLRSFNRFTRDIQDIRARAGTTRSSRPIAQPRRRLRDMRRSPPRTQENAVNATTPPPPEFTFSSFLPDRRASLANPPRSRDRRPASPDVVQLSPAEAAATQEMVHARHLERQETRVEQRERSVERRERSLRDREAALLERERALAIAEQRVSSVRNLVVAQMHEVEELMETQRRDLRRALG